MRIKVILNADPGDFIDINYQYSLAAWIYRVMDKSNSGSAEFWHNSGLSFSETDNRRYKFFTFSNLPTDPKTTSLSSISYVFLKLFLYS